MPPSAAMAGSATRAPVAQLADHELALDLHADDEEEERHQQVVDHVAEVLVERYEPTSTRTTVCQSDS